jgi:hypothetical protein
VTTTRRPPSRTRRKLGDWNTGDGRRPPQPIPERNLAPPIPERNLAPHVPPGRIPDRDVAPDVPPFAIRRGRVEPDTAPHDDPGDEQGRRRRGLADGLTPPPPPPPIEPVPDIDPRMARRRADVDRAKSRRRLQTATSVGAAVALVVITLGVLHTGLVGVRHIRVVDHHTLPEAELLRTADVHPGEPLIDVDGSRAALRLDALPSVATASVERRWPTTVRISVTLRTAVAQIPTGSSLTGPVVEIDSTGRVLARRAVARADLPLLVGVGIPGPVGSWVHGSAGSGQPLGSPATRPRSVTASVAAASGTVRAALAFTAGSEAAVASSGRLGPYKVARVDVAADGSMSAVFTPGPVTVVLGEPSGLADKLTALVSMLRSQTLPAGSTLDLQVPDRPTVASTAGLTGSASP